jgi:hypothetical protein
MLITTFTVGGTSGSGVWCLRGVDEAFVYIWVVVCIGVGVCVASAAIVGVLQLRCATAAVVAGEDVGVGDCVAGGGDDVERFGCGVELAVGAVS